MPKLPKAPLQEAIFEIRWELNVDPTTNQVIDNGFQLAQGKLSRARQKQISGVYKENATWLS